jgi:hypothetical protein
MDDPTEHTFLKFHARRPSESTGNHRFLSPFARMGEFWAPGSFILHFFLVPFAFTVKRHSHRPSYKFTAHEPPQVLYNHSIIHLCHTSTPQFVPHSKCVDFHLETLPNLSKWSYPIHSPNSTQNDGRRSSQSAGFVVSWMGWCATISGAFFCLIVLFPGRRESY